MVLCKSTCIATQHLDKSMRTFRSTIDKVGNAHIIQPRPWRIDELEIVLTEGVPIKNWSNRRRVIAANGKVQNSELDNMAGLKRSLVEILKFFVGACGYLIVVVINVSDCNFVDRHAIKELQLGGKLGPSWQFLESGPSSMVVGLVQFEVYRGHGWVRVWGETWGLIYSNSNSALRTAVRRFT